MDNNSLTADREASSSNPSRILRWCTRLFDSNPFYLLSALSLIYAIYSISVGPRFFASDARQIVFTFSALELYSLMLVSTAVFLARRRVWYDSALLVVLESVLILIPFMLVSHATFVESGLAPTLCIIGSLLAAGRVATFRRMIPHINWPKGLLWAGLLALGLNVALPLVFRRGLNFADDSWTNNELWRSRSAYCWYFVLPALIFLGNTLPRYQKQPACLHAEGRQWLPHLLFSLWIVGTTVHLYSIGYIDDQKLHLGLLTPTVWAISWFFYSRIAGQIEALRQQQEFCLFLPALAPILAMFSDSPLIAVSLFGLNALFLCGKGWRAEEWRFPIALAAFSGFAALLCLPDSVVQSVIPAYKKLHVFFGIAVVASLVFSVVTRTAKGAISGLLALAFTGLYFANGTSTNNAILIQLCFLYPLVHSLWWKEPLENGSAGFRGLLLAGWAFHSFLLQSRPEQFITYLPMAAAAAFFMAATLAWRLRGRVHLILVVGGALVLFLKPAYWTTLLLWQAMLSLREIPGGVLALIASFVLFAIGTLIAIRRTSRNSSPV